MESFLEKAKRDNDIQSKMEKRYAMRNKIERDKLKRAHAKIQALTEKKEEERLKILSEVPLHASSPWSGSDLTILAIFGTLGSLVQFLFFRQFGHTKNLPKTQRPWHCAFSWSL